MKVIFDGIFIIGILIFTAIRLQKMEGEIEEVKARRKAEAENK